MRLAWLACVAGPILIAALPALAASDVATPRDFSEFSSPRLAELLGDPRLAVAGQAATALSRRGAGAFATYDRLLKTGSRQQRWGATVALTQSTADITPFLPTLAKQLSASDELIVRASLAALTKLHSRAAPALPALRPLLSHDETEIRWATIETLGAIGPAAHDLAPSIQPFLGDKAVELRLSAADALRRIQPPTAISSEQLETHIGWLRENVPNLMTQFRVPGVSIAIIHGGEVSWAEGFGVRQARNDSAVTVDTIFEAASLSKPILALVALQLVQENRLDLDRPLVAYLGRDYLSDYPEHRRITARMALTHRTGLPNWRMGYADMGGPLPLQLPPGSEYTYSGEGIFFLQQAIEKSTFVTRSAVARGFVRAAAAYAHELCLDGGCRERSG